jgi:hypothetical protein
MLFNTILCHTMLMLCYGTIRSSNVEIARLVRIMGKNWNVKVRKEYIRCDINYISKNHAQYYNCLFLFY